MPPLPDPSLVPATGNLTVVRTPGSDAFDWTLDLSQTIAAMNIKQVLVNAEMLALGRCGCGC